MTQHKSFNIAFIDFWNDFDPKISNMFIVKYLLTRGQISSPQHADVLICSVFGDEFQQYPEKTKILFSGENLYWWWRHLDINHRLSHYDLKLLTNNDLPDSIWLPYGIVEYDFHTQIKAKMSQRKTKFCCFCSSYSTPSREGCTYRDNFFHYLSQYRSVDSLGRHLNNVGGPVPYQGFDGVVSQYKFMICFENTSAPGYITEKIIRCFVAGVIPIYWGHPDFKNYINAKAVIYVDPNNFEQALDQIKFLDQNNQAYEQVLNEFPILDWLAFDRRRIFKTLYSFLESL